MTPTQNEEQTLAAIVEAVKESGGEIEIEQFEWASMVDLDYNSGFVTVRLKYFVLLHACGVEDNADALRLELRCANAAALQTLVHLLFEFRRGPTA
ncbi:uncharacterized protein BXZ73DRAFT_105160 [Epithele typhae]|uniref:uncharacterized protein n=1 Tax=Epithele typhae TaxID=378194 RepID=UPI00200778A7|nr:uncharacterized protein BXZ73DRAFT_105160 [Epithele typhae]KAH9918764.1 hypothetical protein BXZ73DRAFT_105160 [Epithele typhae]